MMKRRAAALLLYGAALTAMAEVVEIRWAEGGRFAHRGEIAPGKFLELCGRLEAGQTVRWSFDGSAALDFNIHYHEGKAVAYPVKLERTSHAKQQLVVAVTQDYCWMWTNKGATPVKVEAGLQR